MPENASVQRFVVDELPNLVIEHLAKHTPPDLGGKVSAIVLDQKSTYRFNPDVFSGWSFLTEDDMASARTALSDSDYRTLIIVPPGKNVAATMDSTTASISDIFSEVVIALGTELDLGPTQWLEGCIGQIVKEEKDSLEFDGDHLSWEILTQLDGIESKGRDLDTICGAFGLLAGTHSGNWRESLRLQRCIADEIREKGFRVAVNDWLEKISLSLNPLLQEGRISLEEWRIFIRGAVLNDASKYHAQLRWSSRLGLAELPDWFTQLDVRFWSQLLESDTDKQSSKQQVDLKPINSLGAIGKGGRKNLSFVFGNGGKAEFYGRADAEGEIWSYGQTAVSRYVVSGKRREFFLESKTYPARLKFTQETEEGSYEGSASCIVLSDEFPVFLEPANGKVSKWEHKTACFDVELNGTGYHEIKVLLFEGWSIEGGVIVGKGVQSDMEDEDAPVEFKRQQVYNREGVCLVEDYVFETDESSSLEFTATKGGSKRRYTINVGAFSGKSTFEVSSFWEKLVLDNLPSSRIGLTPEVTASPDGVRILERRLIEDGWGYPVVVSTDFLNAGRREVHREQQVFSDLTFLAHSEESARVSQARFREECLGLIDLRSKIIKELGLFENETWVERLDLTTFGNLESLVSDYLSEFQRLVLSSEPQIWQSYEVVLIHDKSVNGREIDAETSCVLLTPLHPLCLGWQVHAQRVLRDTLKSGYPCPQAALVSPGEFPLFWVNNDIDLRPLETNLSYWRCFVKPSSQFERNDELIAFLSGSLGIQLKSMSLGLKANQVKSSLDQIQSIFSSKTRLSIGLSGDRIKSDVNEGLVRWLETNCGEYGSLDSTGEDLPNRPSSGVGLSVCIYDDRLQMDQRFESGKLGYLANDLGANVEYFLRGVREGNRADITFLTSMEMSQPSIRVSAEVEGIPSLAIQGGLIRFSLSRTDRNSAISTSLSTRFADPGEGLLGALVDCHDSVESSMSQSGCRQFLFAPDPTMFRELLANTEFLAVSSPLIDLEFLTGDASLVVWQYDMPAYGESSGSSDGYYLVSSSKPQFERIFKRKLETVGVALQNSEMHAQKLIELADKSGILDLKKFIAGGASSAGEVGMLVAQLLLEPHDYYKGFDGILKGGKEASLALLVPVDPFEKRLNLLRKSIKFRSHNRPDFMVLKLTSECLIVSLVEVKWRSGNCTESDLKKIFRDQLGGFMEFLGSLRDMQHKGGLWDTAFKALIAEMAMFGIKLNQASEGISDGKAQEFMEKMAGVFDGSVRVCLDEQVGRIVCISADAGNRFVDIDKDGFPEVLRISVDSVASILEAERIDEFRRSLTGMPDDWFASDCSDNQASVSIDIPENSEWSSDGTGQVFPHVGGDRTWSADLGDKGGDELHPSQPSRQKNSKSDEDQDSPDKVSGTPKGTESFGLEPQARQSGGENVKGIDFVVGSVDGALGHIDHYYSPSNTNLTQLNMGVVGDLGTGKTQLLKALMFQITKDPANNRGNAPKFLILDTKRDYNGESENDRKLLERMRAQVLAPRSIPLNIFDVRGSSHFDPMMEKATFFVDVLEKIYSGIGPVQRVNLFEAIKLAFDARGYKPGLNTAEFLAPTIKDVFEEYKGLVKKPDAPYSIMHELVLMNLFEEESAKTQSFQTLFGSSLVVSLGEIASRSKQLKVALVVFLNLYQDYMLSVEKKPYLGSAPQYRYVDSYVLIDEAKLVMDHEFQVLEDLLRKGREFGVGVILSSQYLGDFRSGRINYGEALSTWFVHRVPKVNERELSQIGIRQTDGLPTKIKGLKPHYCLYKTHNVDGEIIQANPLYKLIKE